MTPEDLHRRASAIVTAFTRRRLMIATAESCTGGMIAAFLTDIPGSSAVFERGFVTYSNAAKSEMIAVPAILIERHGAVSEAVARAMAEGALIASKAAVAVAVTGIAGPGGGSEEKPVGLVHLAVASRGNVVHDVHRFGALTRGEIRLLTVAAAFDLLDAASGENYRTGP